MTAPEPADGDIVVERADERIELVTLNRPERLNAMTRAMRNRLVEVLEAADNDDAVRAVVVTGAGRAFCSGADLAGRTTFNVAPGIGPPAAIRDGGGELALRLYAMRKPVIGAINGPAVGLGATMTLPMDVRMGTTASRFAFPFGRRGIALDGASSWFLPRVVGLSTALEWTLTGRMIEAAEAHAAGLLTRVSEPGRLIEDALELAREIARQTAPVAAALNRSLLWRLSAAAHPMEAHRAESAALAVLGSAPDSREGVAAFHEKRPPQFSGQVSRDLPDFRWLAEPLF